MTMTPAELRAARKALGLTRPQMADLLGVSLSGYDKWEAPPGTSDTRAMDPTAARVVRWMLEPGRPAEWPAR